jgi:hypothetical protein
LVSAIPWDTGTTVVNPAINDNQRQKPLTSNSLESCSRVILGPIGVVNWGSICGCVTFGLLSVVLGASV